MTPKKATKQVAGETQKQEVMKVELPLGENIEKFVRNEGSTVKVDWKAIESICKEDNSKLYNAVLSYLRQQQILSFEKKGNFGVYTLGISLSPSHYGGLIELFFTSEARAREYADALYAKAHYSIFVKRADFG